ncbi:hypothetical protein [Crocosphaera sp.]|uniref:hypothetical protein n=1 Tax=Crocosphaera sp. TaxID=2729996 RepID=UPI003F26016D
MEKQEYLDLAREWPLDLTRIALELIWQGYEILQANVLSQIDVKQADKQIEKSLSSLLERRIRDVMTGDETFVVQHEVPEFETSVSDKAQPPTYDIAFILRANERIILPLEAKVLHSDGQVGEYVKEINNNFLTCRYAPFSSEGGMLGYLLKGLSNRAFNNIAKKTPCTLSDNPDFPKRHHKTSDHQRSIPENKLYPLNFRCHHLILKIIK